MDAQRIRASRKRVADTYAKFEPDQLIIRDLLALDRTVLANERTLLSYIRTSLMLAASGFTLVKVLPESTEFIILGYILLPLAACTFAYGYWRFRRTRRALFMLNEKPKA